MPRIAKFVHDENIRNFREKLKTETDPVEIERLQALIGKEEELYAEALRAIFGRKQGP